ncbi:MAG: hypothetical protein NZ583_00260 [Desulfobacterota bacterium]|nr:hypothetical protein [Thermodesulfobacteriota bacterium]MDW8001146.1 hypothetical protein [Deltaproteobacteria bacterium]
MRRSKVFAFACLLAVVWIWTLVDTCFAEKGKTYGRYLFGSVISVNHEAKLMTVKSWRGQVTLDISNPTTYGVKDIKEIKPGDRVKVRYTNFGIEIVKLKDKKR